MYRKIHTNEVRNVSLAQDKDGATDLAKLTAYETGGDFFGLLRSLGVSLMVSREYEHFLTTLGSLDGEPVTDAFEIPHPSGMCYDHQADEAIVTSTRTPHQVFFLKKAPHHAPLSDIVPEDYRPQPGTMFLPYKSLILPGGFYLHDIALIGRDIYGTVTGHNFLARLDRDGGWERVWWPKCVDGMGRAGFDQNYLQLNSMAAGDSPEDSFYTAFSDQTHGVKPWKEGYGPKGKGVVFDGASRDVVCRGLTCPHSARFHDGRLWLCNSGYGEVGVVEPGQGLRAFTPVYRCNGFTRGLWFQGGYGFVGLSRVIDFYEPYAPGLKPGESVCAVCVFDVATGQEVGRIWWPEGYQVYDVIVLPGVTDPRLPQKRAGDEFNQFLRYLG